MTVLTLHVWNILGERVASFLHAEDAAKFVGGMDGYIVSYGGRRANIMWCEGAEDFSADESFDKCAGVIYTRMDEMRARLRARVVAVR